MDNKMNEFLPRDMNIRRHLKQPTSINTATHTFKRNLKVQKKEKKQ